MTLNLPKLPWVKVRTHLHVISNLCEIGTSIDSTLKDIFTFPVSDLALTK